MKKLANTVCVPRAISTTAGMTSRIVSDGSRLPNPTACQLITAAIKPMMYLCFSFDHRVLDGLQAARFLTSCRKWLEAVSLETPLY